MKKNDMDQKKEFLKNFSRVFITNLIALLLSIVLIIFGPKILSIQGFGYWQLYVLYAGYVSLFHFGIIDGIYLKIGGKIYQDLDKGKLSGQYYVVLIMQLIISVIFIPIILVNTAAEKTIVFILVIVSAIITNLRGVPLVILQATNRMKHYSIANIVGSITLLVGASLLFIFKIDNFVYLIIIEVFSRLVTLIIANHFCRDIIYLSFRKIEFSLKEASDSIKIGIKISLSYLAGLLVIGIIRFGIEQKWGIEVFSKVSLSLAVINAVMIFMLSLSVVIFPVLKRMDTDRYAEIYKNFNTILTVVLVLLLCSYFPLMLFLNNWFPSYAEGLKYLAFLYPLLLFEGNITVLEESFLKALRKENILLFINVFSLLSSVILTILFAFVMKNLELTIISILIAKFIKYLLAVYFVKYKEFKIKSLTMIYDVLTIVVFLLSATTLSLKYFFVVFIIYVILFVLFFSKKTSESIKFFLKQRNKLEENI